MPISFDEVRAFLLALPGVEEKSSWGTPGFRTAKRMLTRLKEDGDSLVVRIDADEREMLMEADPEAFYLTDHYRPHPYVLVRMSRVEAGTLKRLLMQQWREAATKKHLEAYAAGANG
jgi:hypothetical protein